MKFEVGKEYYSRTLERRVIYVGPSADKKYAVYELDDGDYCCDDWSQLEVIREPRRFWLVVREDRIVEHDCICYSEAAAYAKSERCGAIVIPVVEVLPDEDTQL